MSFFVKPAVLGTSAYILLAVETGLFVWCTTGACLFKTRRQKYPDEVQQACIRTVAIIRAAFVERVQLGTPGRLFFCLLHLHR